jgi:hypothetical protein
MYVSSKGARDIVNDDDDDATALLFFVALPVGLPLVWAISVAWKEPTYDQTVVSGCIRWIQALYPGDEVEGSTDATSIFCEPTTSSALFEHVKGDKRCPCPQKDCYREAFPSELDGALIVERAVRSVSPFFLNMFFDMYTSLVTFGSYT